MPAADEVLVALRGVSLRIGATPLLDGAGLAIRRGERVCLLGRNGSGKSTLLRLVAGELSADAGEVWRRDGLRIGVLPQDLPAGDERSAFAHAADGLGELGTWLDAHREAAARGDLVRMGELQARIEAAGGWAVQHRVEAALARAGVPPEARFGALSGGQRRRVLLARALVAEPDLLLLDEPTNHLDIAAIEAMQAMLAQFPGAVLFVTHDRAFLRALATRIVDLDRGMLRDWPGDYDEYLRRRAEADHAEAQAQAQFDRRLAQEEGWIRKGIEARRTRNEGRVRALMAMREEYAARRRRAGTAQIRITEAERSGKLVAEVERLSFARGGRVLVRDFSTTILRGDRIGIIGPNGAGKSTLIRLLLGELAPDSGRVRLGTRLAVAHFDQLRETLDPDRPVHENIAGGREFVELDGRRVHVMRYLQDFLFTPQRARTPVRALSGGERSRLLLARLFTRPCNLLVLDEPTNDLDLETLELLEERLAEFDGTLLLVSHDREFLDRVVTRSLVFEGDGRIGDYVGGYSDWLRQRPPPDEPTPQKAAPPRRPAPPRRGLSSRERSELAGLPQRIEALEREQARLAESLADADLHADDPQRAQAIARRLAEIDAELTACYARWEALEQRAGG